MRITPDDFAWWQAKAPTLQWTFAKTYAETAPHSYVVLGKTPGMTKDDFVRASRVIFVFGEPRKFWSATDLYLSSDDRRFRWWMCDKTDVDATVLINRVDFSAQYGVQDAPITETGIFTHYDSIAADYDCHHRGVDVQNLWRLINSLTVGRVMPILDLGCGTGALLDSRVCRPEDYTGVDTSRAMLNALVLKHPKVKNLHPVPADDFVKEVPKLSYGLVTALGGSASYLDPETILRLPEIASRHLVLSQYASDYVPEHHGGGTFPETAPAVREVIDRLRERFPSTRALSDRFDVTVLDVQNHGR